MNPRVVGIDLGGTKVEACLVGADGNVLARERTAVQAQDGEYSVFQNVRAVVDAVSDGGEIAAIGIGTPGTYDPDRDAIDGSPHTPLYEQDGFVGRLEQELGFPLAIENDANCLALAEYFAQCQGSYQHVMAVIIGTGFGSGLILGDRLYRGHSGAAGELGHTVIELDGRTCECGKTGCVEAYLSGPSLSRRYRELSGETVDPPSIVLRAAEGDEHASEILDRSCEMLAEVLANAANLLDLDAIILGGGVSNLAIWYQRVPGLLKARIFGPQRRIPILKPVLGDSAGVVGAAHLARRQLGIIDF